ncbi:MAG: flagellar biosynthesis protein FlhB [Piscinibacter sp.]|uniref:flagellar biosynthesis protein FlhB n=1 Tax=Piscinibacter sp. TaxID=1903157 RepID=UPI003D136613
MAEQDDAQERTEQPSAKRLHDAREKGQIARSRELTTMFVLLGGAATLYLSGGHLGEGMARVMRGSFTFGRADLYDPRLLGTRFVGVVLDALAALAPVLFMAVVVALLAPLALGGWNFSAEALQPKFERLDPLKGIKRVFGVRGLVEMLKALAKFVLVLAFAVVALKGEQGAILALGHGSTVGGLEQGTAILFHVFVVVSLASIVIALVDVPFQLWEHSKQLRMSRQDLKEEMKETDGSPELKGRIRNMQHELARRRMMEEVPKADVVVTNPEHYAVALKFDPAKMRAPVVVAKGVEEVAANIRKVAAAHGVTILSTPPLARALYHTTRLKQEIPAGLYLAVARVLAYVFQVRDGIAGASLPNDLPIPDELSY